MHYLGSPAAITGGLAKGSTSTATLEIPLYRDYFPSQSPQATKGTIMMRATSGCWLLRVKGMGSWEAMFKRYANYRLNGHAQVTSQDGKERIEFGAGDIVRFSRGRV